MKRQMNWTIGIDIGKESLVIHRLPDNAILEVSNDKAGLNALLRWLGRDEALRVVFEPTGPVAPIPERAEMARKRRAMPVGVLRDQGAQLRQIIARERAALKADRFH